MPNPPTPTSAREEERKSRIRRAYEVDPFIAEVRAWVRKRNGEGRIAIEHRLAAQMRFRLTYIQLQSILQGRALSWFGKDDYTA